jgi:hypothetical protein
MIVYDATFGGLPGDDDIALTPAEDAAPEEAATGAIV